MSRGGNNVLPLDMSNGFSTNDCSKYMEKSKECPAIFIEKQLKYYLVLAISFYLSIILKKSNVFTS